MFNWIDHGYDNSFSCFFIRARGQSIIESFRAKGWTDNQIEDFIDNYLEQPEYYTPPPTEWEQLMNALGNML